MEDGKKINGLSVRLSDELREALDKEARRRRMKPSTLFRICAADGLEALVKRRRGDVGLPARKVGKLAA